MRFLRIDEPLGGGAAGEILPLGLGPLVLLAGDGDELIEVRLGQRLTADAVLLQHQNSDCSIRLCRRRCKTDERRKGCGEQTAAS